MDERKGPDFHARATTSDSVTVPPRAAPKGKRLAVLTLAALGVVYGDIGTSPLYALKEVFGGAHHPVPINEHNVLGVLSLVFWSLMLIVSIKYVVFILRADNKGEGGIMALMALVLRGARDPARAQRLMLLGLFGASLFFGDGLITPAISVLSAVEGLEVATPALKPFVIPITLVVILLLFVFQKHGTGRVGASFGPIVCVWFAAIGTLGAIEIAHAPQVFAALNPYYALEFLATHGAPGFFALGAVFLAVTGAEALYADIGHFGRRPIRLAWSAFVLPALALNYFGQGALLLGDPKAIENPFYLLAPPWLLYPMVALATMATVIASQAVISGAYSITQQAIQLGYVPRMEIQHTSGEHIGQIYLPGINWALCIGVMILVLGFGSSSSLAAAYGIAVTGTMAITTILAYRVARSVWRWNRAAAAALFGFFLLIDLGFLAANMIKVRDGGWFPLAFGLAVFMLMLTWKRGRALVEARMAADAIPLDAFVASASLGCTKVPGTAVFLTTETSGVPHALLHSMKHYKSLHERVVLVNVITLDVPHVPPSQRVAVGAFNTQFYKVKIFFGFMDTPDLPEALEWCAEQGLRIDMMDTSFFLGRERLIPKTKSEMAFWRERLFVTMVRNARSAADYFRLPPNRVVELGAQVVL
jgi:KUP system potassium uptake protein